MPDKSQKDMRHVAAMLACPHQWGPERKVRVMDKGKAKDGNQVTCSACGTHRIKYEDGTAALVSPDGLSDNPAMAN